METKKVGIMQPYFVPYLGYWQLINAVDEYVIYDDVNFIKGGWINRNRILMNGVPTYFNIPMIGASSFKLINEVEVNQDKVLLNKNLKTLEMAYSKAPYFNEVYPLMEKIIMYEEKNLALYIAHSIKEICNYLDIDTKLIISSDLKKDNSLRKEAKVIAICKELRATDYINAIGGQEMYSYSDFEENNINLSFIDTFKIEYKQFNNEFIPNLSIIDIMMFNSKDEVKRLLNEYELINKLTKNKTL